MIIQQEQQSWASGSLAYIRKANESIVQGNPIQGIRELINLGGFSVSRGYRVFYNLFGLDEAKKKGNFIFQLGNIAALATFGPLAVMLLVGASFLVPPFLMISSAAGAFREFTIYYNERVQLNDLRKKFPYKDDLETRLQKALEKGNVQENEKISLYAYAFGQDKIYQSLYLIRNAVIKYPSLKTEDKTEIIKQLNNIIEKLSRSDNVKPLDLAVLDLAVLKDISKEIKELEKDEAISNAIKNIQEGRDQLKKLPLSKSLKERIENFSNVQNNIYAQDLPHRIKEKVAHFTEGRKIKKQELYESYAQIGNHVINVTDIENSDIEKELPLYPSPNIVWINPKGDKKQAVGVEETQKKGLAEKAKNRLMKKVQQGLGKSELDPKQKEKVEEFNTRFGAIFDAIKNSERRNYLEKSVPRRFVNGWIGVGTFVVTLVTEALLPTLMTPAAPAFLPVVMLLTGLSIVMTAACLFNGLDLEWKAKISKDKTTKPKSLLTKDLAGIPLKPKEKEKKTKEKIMKNVSQSNLSKKKESSPNEGKRPPAVRIESTQKSIQDVANEHLNGLENKIGSPRK